VYQPFVQVFIKEGSSFRLLKISGPQPPLVTSPKYVNCYEVQEQRDKLNRTNITTLSSLFHFLKDVYQRIQFRRILDTS